MGTSTGRARPPPIVSPPSVSFPIVERSGPRGPAFWEGSDADLDDRVPTDLEQGEVRTARGLVEGHLFVRHVTWTVDADRTPWRVTERVSLGPGWYVATLAAAATVLVGSLASALAAVPTDLGSAVAVTGFVGLVVCARAAVAAGVVPDAAIVDDSAVGAPTVEAAYLGVGPAAVVVAGGAAALLLPAAWGVAAAAGTTGLVVAVARPGAYDPLARAGTSVPARVPLVPTLYVLAAGGTAVVLACHTLLVLDVRLHAPAVLALASLGAVGVAGLALAAMDSRVPSLIGRDDQWMARVSVVVGAGVTGVVPLATLAVTGASVRVRPVPELGGTPGLARIWTAAGVVAGTVVCLVALADVGRVARSRVDRLGRRVGTHTAAVFAYLCICAAGSLLASATAFAASAGVALAGTGSVVIVLGAVGFGAPLWFFIAGGAYQLAGLVRVVRRARRGTPAGQASAVPALPLRPAAPVRVVNAADWTPEGDGDDDDDDEADEDDGRPVFAAAYADPFADYILVSTAAVDAFDPPELSTVLAHEESHFAFGGARLQFQFGLTTAFALLGKNVVFSLYDFAEREWTADRYAVGRIESAGVDADAAASLASALDTVSEAPAPRAALLGVLPTARDPEEESVRTDGPARVFAPFFGHFAGGVHPSTDARRRALEIRDWGDRGVPFAEAPTPETESAVDDPGSDAGHDA